jgi:hypothetical protein
VYDHNASVGVARSHRNPKRKKRLPYHSKRNVGSLPIMDSKARTCHHALAKHESTSSWHYTSQQTKGTERFETVSYALACQVKHKSTTKDPIHKDTAGRKWQ